MEEKARVLPSYQKEIKIICAAIGEEIYGVNLEHLEEITKIPDSILDVHTNVKHLKGLIYVRGEVIPIFDLLSFFDIGKIKGELKGKLGIIIRASKEIGPICIAADNVFIEIVSPNSISEPPKVGIKFRETIIGRIITPRGSITYLNPQKIIERHQEIAGIKEEEKELE
jgi:chemotaxis signal transduction protein